LTNTVRYSTYGRGIWDFKIACNIPTNLKTTLLTDTSATLNWGQAAGASKYYVRYRKTGTLTWKTDSTSLNTLKIKSLLRGTSYEWQVQTKCALLSYSSFSSSAIFTTLLYCPSKGNSTNVYIKTVRLGTINNATTNDGGYGNFTNLNTNLAAGSKDTLTIAYASTSTAIPYFVAYLDYNHSDIFNVPGEVIAKGRLSTSRFVFHVPDSI